MVFVTYPNSQEGVEVKDPNPTIIESFAQGGYVFCSIPKKRDLHDDFSRYLGVHLPYKTTNGWDLYKTLHSFLPLQTPIQIEKAHKKAKFTFEQATLSLEMGDGAVKINTKGNLTLPILFDCRSIYDFSTEGRHYNITREGNYIIIKYKKTGTHELNDPALKLPDSNERYQFFTVIRTNASVEKRDEWIQVTHKLEKMRNAGADENYIYHPLSISTQKETEIFFASGFTKQGCIDAISELQSVKTTENDSTEKVSKTNVAAECVKSAYLDLVTKATGKKVGLYAGLPWFFQFWSRDESISLKPLLTFGEYDTVKEILLRELSTLNDEGLIANRYPHSDLASADATGWMCRRFIDLLLEKPNIFSKRELEKLYVTITLSLDAQITRRLENGFIASKPLETWMDTGAGYDEREGACVEIQALFLVQLRLKKLLAGVLDKSDFLKVQMMEATFAQNFKAAFFKEGKFCDLLYPNGQREYTQRTNIFLVYYLYPNLMSKTEWEVAFDTALAHLWQNWGGLSTIAKSHSLYQPNHTGQTNESYHRGDSWFWVNNLAAICLRKLNAEKYSVYVEKIIDASATEILQYGSLGKHAEISNSESLASFGCFNQLWSDAMFLELVGK